MTERWIRLIEWLENFIFIGGFIIKEWGRNGCRFSKGEDALQREKLYCWLGKWRLKFRIHMSSCYINEAHTCDRSFVQHVMSCVIWLHLCHKVHRLPALWLKMMTAWHELLCSDGRKWGEGENRLLLISVQEAGSISLLRKHAQTNNTISNQCNSWNEPGVEIFGAKILKHEEEEEKDSEHAEMVEIYDSKMSGGKNKLMVNKNVALTPLAIRPFLMLYSMWCNKQDSWEGKQWPFYQLEMGLSLSAPKTHISFIFVMVYFPHSPACSFRFTHSACSLTAGGLFSCLFHVLPTDETIREMLLEADWLTFFSFSICNKKGKWASNNYLTMQKWTVMKDRQQWALWNWRQESPIRLIPATTSPLSLILYVCVLQPWHWNSATSSTDISIVDPPFAGLTYIEERFVGAESWHCKLNIIDDHQSKIQSISLINTHKYSISASMDHMGHMYMYSRLFSTYSKLKNLKSVFSSQLSHTE